MANCRSRGKTQTALKPAAIVHFQRGKLCLIFCLPKCWGGSSAGLAEPNPSSAASFRSDFSRKSWHQHHRAAQPGSGRSRGADFISETHVSEGYCIIYINLPLFLSSYSLLSSLIGTGTSCVPPELLYRVPGSKSYVCSFCTSPLAPSRWTALWKPRSYPAVLLHLKWPGYIC